MALGKHAAVRSITAWVLLAGLSASGAALGQQVFKWTDEKGGVHYGARPPAGVAGQSVRIARPAPLSPAQDPDRREHTERLLRAYEEDRLERQKARKEAASRLKDAQKACNAVRSELKFFRKAEGYRVSEQGKNGEIHWVSDAERAQRIKALQEKEQALCR